MMVQSFDMTLLDFFRLILRFIFLFLLAGVFLVGSVVPRGEVIEQVRYYTRQVEFDYVAWTLEAMGKKLGQAALASSAYTPGESRRLLVMEYLQLVQEINRTEAEINSIYGDPQIADPQAASAELRQKFDTLQQRRAQIQPLAEATLQEQVSQVVASLDLTLGGQPVPPVLYHSTPLPLALIVSPRETIRQDADISLMPELTLEEQITLEEQVDAGLDVSSLVVHIGGVGVYPTMVQQTSDLNWLSEVVAHEWVHNFLTLRPLGINYLTTPALRTMNETTAALAGKEIGSEIIRRFYPELVPPPPPPESSNTGESAEPSPPAFDFYAEMRETRVTVDQLLAEGKVAEAEAYMEARRVMFWERGYRIRKLNQAYFAFYGAYDDRPGGGAAGEDPVGAAVRALRSQSATLAEFLNRISWMYTFEQLQQAVNDGAS